MAALHNILIRSFNSIIYHAPNVGPTDVPPFMKYCRSVSAFVHEHHATEEQLVFPFFESKLGKGAMDANVTQHQDFLPQYNEWDQLCQDIQSGKSQYEAESFVTSLRKSTDLLVEHLADEIPTMEASKLKPHFSEAELQALEIDIDKKVKELSSLSDFPLLLVNGDTEYNPWFPEAPAPILFIVRHVLMRLAGDMWKYGQSDKYYKLKPEFKSLYGL
ncbi:hypothetical protein BDV93DRAFT_519217 [Ceratobasidium sp. AG-I]|nr:hypothetical protein BDV93DRAFT_519217 [Ceratobasidium sp. AG-I]